MFYTDRLLLRAMDAGADMKHMIKYMNSTDTLLAIQADLPVPKSAAAVKAHIEADLLNKDMKPHFVVCLKPSNPKDLPENLAEEDDLFIDEKGNARYPMIGLLVFHKSEFSFTKRAMSFGVIFDEAHRGKGYGTELIRWACSYVFDYMGMHRFELRVRADNAHARKCYDGIGFVTEGIQRDAFYYDGKWGDQVTMAILEREWRQIEQQRKNS